MAANAQRIGGTQRRLGFTPIEISTWTGKAPTLNKYGRDTDSPSERERERTAWLKSDPADFTGKSDFTGYTALPHSWFADLGRLTRGKPQILLLIYGWSQSYGRERKSGEKAPDWTSDLKVKDLANIMNCTERLALDDLADAKERKVIDLRRPAPGIVRIRLRFQGWEALPDYQAPAKPAPQPVPEEPELEEPLLQESKEPVVLLKRPAYIRAGQSSKPVPIVTAVKAFRLVNECSAGLGLDAVVIAGELQLRTRFQNTRPIEINDLIARNGSPLPKVADRDAAAPVVADGSAKNGRSNGFNNIDSNLGSPLPKDGRKPGGQTLPALLAGLTERGVPVAEDHAARVLREIGATPLPFFFQTLETKLAKAAAKHEPYNPAWLVRTAKDAAAGWAIDKATKSAQAVEVAETPQERERNIRNARRTFNDPDATAQDQEFAKETLLHYGIPLPEDVS